MNVSYDVRAFPSALRKLAADLESLGDVELASTALQVSLQVRRSYADEGTRFATVTHLATALGSCAAIDEGFRLYGTPCQATRHGARISVFTAPDSFEGGES